MPDTAPTLDQMLNEWFAVAQQIGPLVEQERALRTAIFNTAFPTPVPGTNKIKLDHGMALIADYKMNYTIDRAGLEAALSDAGDNERAIIENVISYSPKVKEGEFKKLEGDAALLVGPFITQKPGLPSIEIKPQSKVKW